MGEPIYLVRVGNGPHLALVLGPFKTESDAILGKRVMKQWIDLSDKSFEDSWVEVEEREVLTL